MKTSRLHHVTVMSRNLDQSTVFYTEVLGLERVPRPSLSRSGSWLTRNGFMVHIIVNPDGTFRSRKTIEHDDVHFALRVENFEAAIKHLTDAGFYETDDEDDPQRMVVKRSSPVGFPQIYVRDPDGDIIEINAA